MSGISWPTLTPGAKAKASDVEAKFDWIEGNIVPMNGGSATDGAYDLGTSAARWRDIYSSANIYAAGNIAINHTNPSYRLDIMSDDSAMRVPLETTTSAIYNRFIVGTGTASNANALGGIRAVVTQADPLTLKSAIQIRANIGDNDSIVGTFSEDGLTLQAGTSVNEFSTDGTLAGNSDEAVPTEKAVKTYVDSKLSDSYARGYRGTSDFTTTAGTLTVIQFNAESFDGLGEFTTSANYNFKATVAGKYFVHANIATTAHATGSSETLQIFKNGSVTSRFDQVLTGTNAITFSVTDILDLAANDTVDVRFRNDLSNAQIISGADISYVAIRRVH